ncbi:MAG: conjugative transfer signal peptidase TraF [Alphaproteobacteria bacterium]|nr:conjugative transfer signal peptidase TraF [Alphaproteobacteria bacterium]
MRRKSLFRLAVAAGAGIALSLLPAVIRPVPLLVWNASASVPVGLYRSVTGTPNRGDFVLARTPERLEKLATERGYLPAGVPLVKRVAAIAGDHVCAHESTVSINGRTVARQHETDRTGRHLPRWSECRILRTDEFFLLAEAPDSFDSRYFGPVNSTALTGRLEPLWTE